MTKKPYNNFLKYSTAVLRIIIGLIFFLSGLLKIIDISFFREVILSFGMFNSQVSFLISIIIPILEIVLGLLLSLGIYKKIVAIHLNTLIILFAWVTFYILKNNPELPCGCIGKFFNMTFSNYHFIVLLVLFILNLILIIETKETWSLGKLMKDKISKRSKMLIIEVFTYIFIAVGIILIALAIYTNLRGIKGFAIQRDTATKLEESVTSESEKSSLESNGTDADDPDIVILTVDEAYQAYIEDTGYIFVDVRTASEYETGYIEGAILIPLSEISDRFSELPKDSPIVVYCNGSSCNRSGAAAEVLINNGFKEVYDLGGTGIIEWIEKGYPNSK